MPRESADTGAQLAMTVKARLAAWPAFENVLTWIRFGLAVCLVDA
jgi:hypothetical protein